MWLPWRSHRLLFSKSTSAWNANHSRQERRKKYWFVCVCATSFFFCLQLDGVCLCASAGSLLFLANVARRVKILRCRCMTPRSCGCFSSFVGFTNNHTVSFAEWVLVSLLIPMPCCVCMSCRHVEWSLLFFFHSMYVLIPCLLTENGFSLRLLQGCSCTDPRRGALITRIVLLRSRLCAAVV